MNSSHFFFPKPQPKEIFGMENEGNLGNENSEPRDEMLILETPSDTDET